MKALVRRRYGSPEDLVVEDVPIPTPAADELLVRVHAVSLNLGDWELLTGRPRYISVLATAFGRRPTNDPGPYWPRGGVLSPKHKILGTDVSGRVEASGSSVTRFEVGDEIFGMSDFGALAEYVCIKDSGGIAIKPAAMPDEDAAAIPQAAFIALAAMRDRDQVGPGKHVLINGAGGGAGTTAIQLAHEAGAEVTGVDNGAKLELMTRVGADHVLDYRAQDVTTAGVTFDLVLDLATHRSIFDYRRVLSGGGIYMTAGGAGRPAAQAALVGPLVSWFGDRTFKYLLAADDPAGLDHMSELYAAGRFKPVVDRTFTLEAAHEAFTLVGEGRALGNVVITL